MARVTFTANLQRHVKAPALEVHGRSVRDVLEAVFQNHEQLRGYIVDEQGALRKHMIIFIKWRADSRSRAAERSGTSRRQRACAAGAFGRLMPKVVYIPLA